MRTFFIIFFLSLFTLLNAQDDNNWRISAGINVVDIRTPLKFSDIVKDYFNGSIQDLNMYSFPARIAFERTLSDKFALQLSVSYNQVKKGYGYSEGNALLADKFIYGDLKLKYDLNSLLGDTKWFDPFILAGAGYSSIGDKSDLKGVAGAGSNFWLSDHWGINLESSYNHNFQGTFESSGSGGTGTDFFQHNIGVIYSFDPVGKKAIKDNDGDGIENKKDKCPEEFGVAALEGCPEPFVVKPDTDGDGIIDEVDKCPTVIGVKENFGCPDVDTDEDGIIDRLDKCVNEKGKKDTTGCPHVDSDGDGIPDHLDKCPTVKGVKTNNGCEEVIQVIDNSSNYIKEIQSIIIYFDFDSYEIDYAEIVKLDNLYNIIQNLDENFTYVFEGNTDQTGLETYNKVLSQKRGESVINYLKSKGIPSSKLSTIPLGETNPAVMDNDASNRRVEIKVK